MRYWSLLLHFYQPPTQEHSVTRHILESCYIPVTKLLLDNPNVHVTCNISGSLIVELEAINAHNFFDNIRELVQRGQIELTNSPLYHPLIPLSPIDAIQRQLEYNRRKLEYYCGAETLPGLFPPELAVTPEALIELTSDYKWCMIDESSIEGSYSFTSLPEQPLVRFGGSNLIVSSRALSEIIRAFPTFINAKSLISFIENNSSEDRTIFSGHDVEVFGHHYEERIHLFEELITSNALRFITVSEGIAHMRGETPTVDKIFSSSWQTTREHIQSQNPFPMWNDASNRLQQLYAELASLAYTTLSSTPKTEKDDGLIYASSERHYDQGIASCYPYWLSNRPWWHPEFVEAGARNLMKTIRTLPVDQALKLEGEKLYITLIQEIWEYHWSGKVEQSFVEYDKQQNKNLTQLPDVS